MKQNFLSQNKVTYIDYKDIEVIKKFVNPHGRLIARKRTGVSANHQRQLANALKRARFLGLMPFVVR
ncbi:TPA: 30S ribosomal protein S18 [Candidatus Taylorbacteria bacterium]|jgi:small subunit ribosomal protein S18|nr:30S ribosomal protein S18 [Candidatus Taylorbacteria bacterium]